MKKSMYDCTEIQPCSSVSIQFSYIISERTGAINYILHNRDITRDFCLGRKRVKNLDAYKLCYQYLYSIFDRILVNQKKVFSLRCKQVICKP